MSEPAQQPVTFDLAARRISDWHYVALSGLSWQDSWPLLKPYVPNEQCLLFQLDAATAARPSRLRRSELPIIQLCEKTEAPAVAVVARDSLERITHEPTYLVFADFDTRPSAETLRTIDYRTFLFDIAQLAEPLADAGGSLVYYGGSLMPYTEILSRERRVGEVLLRHLLKERLGERDGVRDELVESLLDEAREGVRVSIESGADDNSRSYVLARRPDREDAPTVKAVRLQETSGLVERSAPFTTENPFAHDHDLRSGSLVSILMLLVIIALGLYGVVQLWL